LEDSLVVLPSLRSAAPLKSKSASSRIEFKMLYAQPVLQAMRALFLEVAPLFSTQARSLMALRERTSTRMSVSRSSARLAEFHARPSARTLASRAPSLLTSSLKTAPPLVDSMLLKEFTLT
jgi:hypothetical protein